MLFIDDSRSTPRINIIAANATLLLTGGDHWQGNPGTLIELDHFNPETNFKETRVKICGQIFLQERKKLHNCVATGLNVLHNVVDRILTCI